VGDRKEEDKHLHLRDPEPSVYPTTSDAESCRRKSAAVSA